MALEMRQQMKMSQKLVMTPQLQQAIKLLQLSKLELQDVVRQELEDNPVLEEANEFEEAAEAEAGFREHDEMPQPAPLEFKELEVVEARLSQSDWDMYLNSGGAGQEESYHDEERTPFESLVSRKANLADHLISQLGLCRLTERELEIGRHIIGNIDGSGYLQASLGEISQACGACVAEVEAVLTLVQQLEPAGIGARDLRECLLLQIHQLGPKASLAEAIVADHLKLVENRNYRAIAKALGVELEEVFAAVRVITALDPKPGRGLGQDDIQYISPDIFVYKVDGEYQAILNDEGMPNLRINPFYAPEARDERQLDAKAEEYIGDKTRSALWLIKSIQQRQRTIYKVSKSIIKFQREFLDSGIAHLRPLVLRDVAEDIGMHESTISRVTTNKYMQTPQGLFELKFFFNSGIATGEGDFIASESVKNKIRSIVSAEDPRKPYSDQRLAEILSDHNIHIARRTVTKYREMLQLGSSSERKRYF